MIIKKFTDSDVITVLRETVVNYKRKKHNFDIITDKGKTKHYLNIPIAFDTETTSFRNTDNVKQALLYSWQFCIDDLCVYGRYADDVPLFVNQIVKVIRDIFDSAEVLRIVIYVHNLSFDFHFIHKLLNIKSNSILAYDKRTVFYFETCKECNTVIEYRCSYILTHKPLSALGKGEIQKQEKIDYSLIRHSQTALSESEIKYNCYDVYVLSDFIYRKFETGETLDLIPRTLTGYARKHLKDVTGFNSQEKTTEQKIFFRIVNNCKIENYKELQIYRSCFYGGFTHGGFCSNGIVYDNVKHIDFTSSYPTVLLSEKYPVTTFSRFHPVTKHLSNKHDMNEVYRIITGKNHTELRSINIGYISLVRFKTLSLKADKYEIPLSVNKILNREDNDKFIIHSIYNGRVKHGENILIWCTDIDFDIFREYYDCEYIIEDMEVAQFDYLPSVFCKAICDLYADKTTLKGVSDKKADYDIKKVVLNSLYGLCVTDPVSDDFIYDSELREVREKTSDIEKFISSKLSAYNRCYGKMINYMWGVFCTAYARCNLFSGITEMSSDYLYADTDSLFFVNYEKHAAYIAAYNLEIIKKLKENTNIPTEYHSKLQPLDIKGIKHPLGVWDFEDDCILFSSVGAKRYIQAHKSKLGDYDFFFTFAGINSDNLKKHYLNKFREDTGHEYDYNSLKDAQTICEMFSSIAYGESVIIDKKTSGKITSSYIDTTYKGSITDYQGNAFNYVSYGGVNLEPQDFEISITDDIKNTVYNIAETLIKRKYRK